jgi:hypothetical protein
MGENLLIGIESLGFRLESELEIISPVACNDGVATDSYIMKLPLRGLGGMHGHVLIAIRLR